MVKNHHPRRGSMQFWPRSRSKHSLARIRSWADEKKVKPLGFIGFKAGMVHVFAIDNRGKSNTKGEEISMPATVIDCPPMSVIGVAFYRKWGNGTRKLHSILAKKLPKELTRKFPVPKKDSKNIDSITEFDDLRLIVSSNPKAAQIGTKKPKVQEIAIGGSKDEKFAYAKEILGKEITINDVFEKGIPVDIHGVSKGKGFQGTVKRFGVAIKQHKGEKTKRGIGNLGAWTPKRVDYRVPQPGKMGYHLRTEYNKKVLQIGENGKTITPKKGFAQYGVVKNNYLLIHGSVVGPRKMAVVLTAAIRPTDKVHKDAFTIK